MPEAFDAHGKPVAIPAALLSKRLPHTLCVADTRERTVYKYTDPKNIGRVLWSYCQFVELCEKMEAQTGV